MPTVDPYNASNFRVEIDGIAISGFLSVSGIEAEAAIVDYREGMDPIFSARKLPGITKYSNLVLKRGMNNDHSLWQWMKKTIDGKTEKKDMSVVVLDDAGQEKIRFNFVHAFPTKWSGPDLNASSNEVAIETLEIAHEGLTLA